MRLLEYLGGTKVIEPCVALNWLLEGKCLAQEKAPVSNRLDIMESKQLHHYSYCGGKKSSLYR